MNTMREYINIITEAVTVDREQLPKKKPLGGFTPIVDPEFDTVDQTTVKDVDKFLRTAVDPSLNPEEAIEAKETKQLLIAAIKKLKPYFAQALHYRYVDNMSFIEIGEALRPPVSRQRAHQIVGEALKRLMRNQNLRKGLGIKPRNSTDPR